MSTNKTWSDKDKRISFLSVFSTLIGATGADITTTASFQDEAYRLVDNLFERYPGDIDEQFAEPTPLGKPAIPAPSGDPRIKVGNDGIKRYMLTCEVCHQQFWGKEWKGQPPKLKTCWPCKQNADQATASY